MSSNKVLYQQPVMLDQHHNMRNNGPISSPNSPIILEPFGSSPTTNDREEKHNTSDNDEEEEEFVSSFITEQSSANCQHPLHQNLVHIFKFLSFREHLQNSTPLVCKQWFECLVGMMNELKINSSSLIVNDEEYCQQLLFLQPPSSPTSNNSSTSTGSQHSVSNTNLLRELFEENTMIEEIEKLSSIVLFEKLQRVELDHLGDGFSFELIYFMIYNLKELKEIKLSECTLLRGRLTKRIKSTAATLEQPKTTKRKSIFSIFKRSKSTATSESSAANQDLTENKIESVREDYRRDTTLQRCMEEDVSATFSSITSLNLFKCKLNDEIYRFFMEKLANLKTFKLIECTGLSSIELNTESSDLSHVEIDFDTNPPSLTLDFNCKKLTDSLTYLSIDRVHAFNFEKFMERCTQLKTLKIMSYFDEKFTKQMETIENLIIEPYCCANFDNIRNFLPNLTTLHLHNVKYDLGNIFPFFPKLREVRVNFLHDDAVRSENLEELIVLGDTSVECTIDCPNLKTLKIQKINQKSFSNKFENLTHLDMSNSIQVNDQVLEKFLQCTPNLKTLLLSDCPNISKLKFSSITHPHLISSNK